MLTLRFSLSAWRRGAGVQQSRPNIKHRFCSTGGVRRWGLQTGHAGGGVVSTPLQIITPNLPFGVSWEHILSIIREVINCTDTSWEQSATWGFIIQVTPNVALQISQPSCCQLVYPTGDVMWWSTGRSVGVKALDSSVERLWFNLQSTSRQFLLSLQSNIPQCLLV